jgi:hypothetical protein
MYAHASRVFHLESNPGNARALVQQHGDRDVWLNPPPLPLAMDEMDGVYDLTYARAPHPSYGKAHIPAWEMIRYSVNIMRGCFGGCTFCSITEHEGRIIQSRSEPSILREIELIRDTTKNFAGTITDLGGPTANMYRLACKDKKVEDDLPPPVLRVPDHLLQPGHRPQQADLAVPQGARDPGHQEDPDRFRPALRPGRAFARVREGAGDAPRGRPAEDRAGAHGRGHAVEDDEAGYRRYDEFKAMFDKYSKEAGKKQYLIPYFIAAHPGSTDEDMLNLALWLKKNNFHLDQVQTFTPTPMAMATTMYHTGKNPLAKVTDDSEAVLTAKSGKTRKLHKAFLRYYDPENWPVLREGLKRMGRGDLIGNGERHLVPPAGSEQEATPRGERKALPLVAEARSAAPKGRVIEVATRRNNGRGNGGAGRNEPAPFAAPPGKAKPGILSTIKAKPKAAGRK